MSIFDQALAMISLTCSLSKRGPRNTRDIHIDNINLTLAGRELLIDASLSLNWGNRYGLLGTNGCGKSLLMGVLGRRLLPIPDNIDTFHVTHEIEPTELSALEAVLAVDSERERLEKEAEHLSSIVADAEGDDAIAITDRLTDIYERLDDMDAATAGARAGKILHGLGFTTAMQSKKCKDFSGGWRMRIALARALFLNPSFLLLDEPTNHLDMEAVVWLEGYLAKFKRILLIISHSQDFLNSVCTNIIHMNNKTIEEFGGNYDTYVQTRREMEEAQMKKYEWEQDQIKHMKDYIARFGHGSAKLARQAQSKEKTLAKMERSGLTEKVGKESKIVFRFPDPGTIPPPVLQISGLCFRYPGGDLLYSNVDYGIDLDSRIALVGPNGAGKSTLLKLITGDLIPTSGSIRPHPHLRMAKYTQHFVDTLDLDVTPLEFFGKKTGETAIEKLRGYVGRFGITGDNQTTKIMYLSDGLKSRIVFALMAFRTPHLLLLDEPTNHLDMETIDALADSINNFTGGVVLVSHDMRLIGQVAKEVWECKDRAITKFEGDIVAYKQKLKDLLERQERAFEAEIAAKK